MNDQETAWDRLLQINTTGRDEKNADQYHHPYEPTPYSVLERIAGSGLIGKDDVVLDYGCGKGRVGFFLSCRTKAKTIGIEYDDRIYRSALENRKTVRCGAGAEFVLASAEAYAVPTQVNRCYFFNPFSLEILQKVLARILESYYDHPREIRLFFYYPSTEYISCLMNMDALEFCDEIPCGDLFRANDPRERILVFSLPNLD